MQTCFIVITIVMAIIVILLLMCLAFCSVFLRPDEEDDCGWKEYKEGVRMSWLLIAILLIAIAMMWTWGYWLPNTLGYYKELLIKLF